MHALDWASERHFLRLIGSVGVGGWAGGFAADGVIKDEDFGCTGAVVCEFRAKDLV